jgi:hypothetical protein
MPYSKAFVTIFAEHGRTLHVCLSWAVD